MRALFAIPAAVLVPVCDSVSLDSGVVWLEVCLLNDGLNSDVNDGEGGNGVGGRL